MLVPAFAARKMDRCRPWIAEMAGQLLDGVLGEDEFDLVDVLARQLPILVVCKLLGVPREGADLCRAAATILGGSMHDEQTALGVIESLDAFVEYAGRLIDDKRDRHDDDLISDLIRAEVDGKRLDRDELIAACGFVLFAGHRTTVQLIGNGVLALLRNPRQIAMLRGNPALLPNAVEEFLRYDGPVNPGMTRYVRDDIDIGGITIPKGSYAIVATAAANRDPAVWESPDELRIDRDFRQPQLAFGAGIHFCLGARLARIECEIAIGALLERYSHIELAMPLSQLRWEDGLVRCLLELPVRVSGSSPPTTDPAGGGPPSLP
jgi:cytochrome P450